MNKRRLLALADKLEEVPRDRFNFSSWVGEDWGGKQDLSCGTTACALGWATTIPMLRKAGLYLRKSRSRFSKDRGEVVLKGLKRVKDGCDLNHISIRSAAVVFGITTEDARDLFIPGFRFSANITPKQLAKHIREFVAAA